MSATGHERRFCGVRDGSGLPPTPEGFRQRGEPTLRAITGLMRCSTGILFNSRADRNSEGHFIAQSAAWGAQYRLGARQHGEPFLVEFG
jgi:hypothetical protein